MQDSLRWGILGTGWIAGQLTADLLANGKSVVAVGSRNHDSAAAFAAAHGIPVAYSSYEALAADPGVDVIYVATPHPFHHANARLALEGGKHVLVEKPFTMTAAEASDLVDLATRRGLVILEAMWTRWLPHMVRIREIIAAGTLGEVRTVLADHNQNLPDDPHHRINDPALGGGALLDLGIYPVSLASDLFGQPTSVAAISSPVASTGVDRQTAILLGYPAGQQAVLHTALDTLGPNTASIIGTEGRIDIAAVWYSPTTFTVFDGDGAVIERFEQAVVSRGMQYQAFELERLVAAGLLAGEVLAPAESVAIMATLDEVRRQIGLHYPDER